jgi:hypothetical protein
LAAPFETTELDQAPKTRQIVINKAAVIIAFFIDSPLDQIIIVSSKTCFERSAIMYFANFFASMQTSSLAVLERSLRR